MFSMLILLLVMILLLPLFAYTKGKTGIVKRRFVVYIRATAAYVQPATAGEFSTLTTGMVELGEFEDKSPKVTIKKNETIDLNDGTTKVLDYIGTVEAKDVNISIDNMDEVALTYDNKDVDVLFYCEATGDCIFVMDFNAHFDEEWLSGGISSLLFNGTKKVTLKSEFRDAFTEPLGT